MLNPKQRSPVALHLVTQLCFYVPSSKWLLTRVPYAGTLPCQARETRLQPALCDCYHYVVLCYVPHT
jgi:hypothetical protein